MLDELRNQPIQATPLRFMVVERFDESLAVFSLDFNLSSFDVAYNVMKKKNRPSLALNVRNYLEAHQPNDMALYQVAQQQLDRRIKSYPKEVFKKRLEEMQSVRVSFQKYCFRTRPSVPKSELKRVEDGENIDWNRERTRENYAKNSLKKKFALEFLQERILGTGENYDAEIPEELRGLDMNVYGSLNLQCYLMEMDELRWLRWTTMWKTETKGMDITVENMLKKGLSRDLPHRMERGTPSQRKSNSNSNSDSKSNSNSNSNNNSNSNINSNSNVRMRGTGVERSSSRGEHRPRPKAYFSQSKLREMIKIGRRRQTPPPQQQESANVENSVGEVTSSSTSTSTQQEQL